MIINCTQHKLEDRLEKVLIEEFKEIKNLKDLSPELFKELSDCPFDLYKLLDLVDRFYNFIVESNCKDFLLPIGSPAFQFLLVERLSKLAFYDKLNFHFAHSKRNSIEKIVDGKTVKEVRFEFEHLITV